MYIRADDTQYFFKRENYDLITYLGDLGGLLDVLFAVGSVTTGLLTSKLFKAKLIS